MPLVRTTTISPGATLPDSRELLLKRLSGSDPDDRRRAAHGLSCHPDATAALAARLECEPDLRVRDALFSSLVDIGGTPTASLVASLLRSADAGLRGGAVEALKRLGEDAFPVLDALLGDPDPDVRILVVEVTRAWPSALAVPRLQRVIENDPHVNVCGAAVDAATEAGTGDLLMALEGLRVRFADEPFLVFAVDIACSRLRASCESIA